MTRESKLALVLGFSLMLFVLILVSDHMAARNAPVIATNIDKRPDVGVPPLPGPGTGGELVLQGENGAQALPQEPPQIVDPAKPEGDTRMARGTQPEREAPTVPPTKLPEAPSVKTYAIKSGDTFAAIAQREYKKRSLGTKLAEFNGIDPSRMKVGTIVKLPPIGELDPTATPSRLASNEQPASDRTAAVQPAFRMYRVKQGDTLYGIAEREMGTSGRLKELRSANNELLRGSDDLHPGMQIRIPERAGALTSATTTDA
ncbi:MAG: LysM peptidoglycan-binding domain-containing protein [Phycisphaerae bacterium]|jgi:nucleoid-associated protein YgaU|nr:LysM peptidoglycan-binding domain-containing protein [Phycisphaerae bacterium]